MRTLLEIGCQIESRERQLAYAKGKHGDESEEVKELNEALEELGSLRSRMKTVFTATRAHFDILEKM